MKSTMFYSACLASSIILLLQIDQTEGLYNTTAGACAQYQPVVGTCVGSGVTDVADVVGRLLNGKENYVLIEIPQINIYFLLAVDYQSIPAVTAILNIQRVVAFILLVNRKYYIVTTVGCGSVIQLTNSAESLERLGITYATIYKGLTVINQQYPSECNLFSARAGTSIGFDNCINAVIVPYGSSAIQVASNVRSTISTYGFKVSTRQTSLGTCIEQPESPGLQAECIIQNCAFDLAQQFETKKMNPTLLLSPSTTNMCRLASAVISVAAKTPQLQSAWNDFKVVIFEQTCSFMVYFAGYLPVTAPYFYYEELISAC